MFDNNYNDFDYISTNSPEHQDSFKSCIIFQKSNNKDGYNHNNFYLEKKESSVDMSSLNIYLLAGNKYCYITIQDYFETECDINSQYCKFIAKNYF